MEEDDNTCGDSPHDTNAPTSSTTTVHFARVDYIGSGSSTSLLASLLGEFPILYSDRNSCNAYDDVLLAHDLEAESMTLRLCPLLSPSSRPPILVGTTPDTVTMARAAARRRTRRREAIGKFLAASADADEKDLESLLMTAEGGNEPMGEEDRKISPVKAAGERGDGGGSGIRGRTAPSSPSASTFPLAVSANEEDED